MRDLRLRSTPLWEGGIVYRLDQRRVLDVNVTLDQAIKRFGPVRAVHRVKPTRPRDPREGDRRG